MTIETGKRQDRLAEGSKILIFCDAAQNGAKGRVTSGGKTIFDNVQRVLTERGYVVHPVTPDLFPSISFGNLPEVNFAGIRPYGLRRIITDFQPDGVMNLSPEGTVGTAALISCARYPSSRLADQHSLPYVASYTTNYDDYANVRLRKVGLSVPDWLVNAGLRAVYRRADAVTVPTERMGAKLQRAGIENTVIFQFGVDDNLFRPLQEGEENAYAGYNWYQGLPVLLNYGRIGPEKNPEDFLRLDTPGFHKVMIGDGPIRKKLERKYGDSTHFLGKKHGEELAHHVRSATLTIMPSLTETWGIVLSESAVSGTPFVAYDVQGPQDVIIPGVNGVLIPMGESLASGIVPALQLDRQRCAQVSAVHSSWDTAVDVLLDNTPRVQWR